MARTARDVDHAARVSSSRVSDLCDVFGVMGVRRCSIMNNLRPCSYCGHTQFLYVPNMALDAGYMTTVLGMAAMKGGGAAANRWIFTLVSCTNCGNSLIFNTDTTALQGIPGAKIIAAGGS